MQFFCVIIALSIMTNASIAQWWSNRLLTGRLQVRALFGAPKSLRRNPEFYFFINLIRKTKKNKILSKIFKKVLTMHKKLCILTLLTLRVWRHSSVVRAIGSYPIGRKFKSFCRYQFNMVPWSSG